MIIESSAVIMSATRDYYEKELFKENLDAWVGDRNSDGASISIKDSSDFSSAALDSFNRFKEIGQLELDPLISDEFYIMKLLIENLTGHKINVRNVEINEDTGEIPVTETATAPQAANKGGEGEGEVERVGWGVIYEREQSYTERETTQFSATGVVKTADGREINFALDLKMEREYSTSERVSIRAGDALIDPLVVNFGSSSAALSDVKFAFDIDSDGKTEDVSFVKQGSGVLVFDKNGDGKATDGSELFGPTTGRGFAELAAYDNDSNGWIDENDTIYDILKIWTKDAQGTDQLSSLSDKDVGAIYLGSKSTAFDLTTNDNSLNGRIASTGIYLKEDGEVRTIQQVDLAV